MEMKVRYHNWQISEQCTEFITELFEHYTDGDKWQYAPVMAPIMAPMDIECQLFGQY